MLLFTLKQDISTLIKSTCLNIISHFKWKLLSCSELARSLFGLV